jgi:hypothetical protein
MTSHWRLRDCGCGDGCGDDGDDGYDDDHGYEDSAVGRRNRRWGPLEKPWK